MPTRTWAVTLDDGIHEIDLVQNPLTGRGVVRLDGRVIARLHPLLWARSCAIPFRIGAHTCAIHMSTNGLVYRHALIVDGRDSTTGRNVAPAPPQQPVPAWAWPFVLACFVLMVCPYPQPMPLLLAPAKGALGGLGLAVCLSAARNTALETSLRVARSLVVVAAVWVLYLGWLGVGHAVPPGGVPILSQPSAMVSPTSTMPVAALASPTPMMPVAALASPTPMMPVAALATAIPTVPTPPPPAPPSSSGLSINPQGGPGGTPFSLVILSMHPGATYTVSWDTPSAPLASPNTPWGTCTGTLNSGGNQIAECLSPATSTPGWHQVLVLDGQGGEEHTAFWVRS